MEPDFSRQRMKMVDGQVRTTDVTDVALLGAMGSVPRERFVAADRRELAYIDEDLRLSSGNETGPRYLMEPSPFAKLVQLAEVRPTDKVLDVGCVTGYSAAVLSQLAASVVALESDAALASQAAETLKSLGCGNVTVVEGPLNAGHAGEAPYDVILIGGSVANVPDSLLGQLAEGGRLVVVVGHGNAGQARLYLNVGGTVTARKAFNAAIKSLPGFESNYLFEF